MDKPMWRDAAAVKRELVRIYGSARKYHEDNYLADQAYAPLRWRQQYIERMIAELKLPVGARVLDVGCGPGELIISLLSLGYDVTGIDIAAGMVKEAIETARRAGFPSFDAVRIGDIEALELADGSFDLVVAAGVLEYQPGDSAALSEINRVLRDGGHMILNVTNRYSYTGCLDNPYRWLKRHSATRSVVSVLKRSLGRGPLTDFPERRTHSPWQFDRTLGNFGFRKVRHNYFHFSPLPVPLATVFSSFCLPIGKRMEALSAGPLGVLGGGYLVMARKERALPRDRN